MGSNKLTPSIGVIGCGSLGSAMLQGLLSAREARVVPSKIIATVRTKASSDTLSTLLHSYSKGIEIIVQTGQNVDLARRCDVVILACAPNQMTAIVQENGMREALEDKILISVLAGTTTEKIIQAILGTGTSSEARCWVARTLPNLAVAQHSSATAVEEFSSDFPAEKADLVLAILRQLGGVVQLPASLMDASTVLCGSTPAWIALFADGLVDGAVAAGVPRSKANSMLAQMLASTAALLKDGQSPSALRESICAMPGCTIQGNLVLETHGVRGAAASAMKTAIEAAQKLGD